MKPVIDINRCDGCGRCMAVCQKNVFVKREITDEEYKSLVFPAKLKSKIKGKQKAFVANGDNCVSCNKCVKFCHEHAIKLIEN